MTWFRFFSFIIMYVLFTLTICVYCCGCSMNSNGIFWGSGVLISDSSGKTNINTFGNPPFKISMRSDRLTEVTVSRNDNNNTK